MDFYLGTSKPYGKSKANGTPPGGRPNVFNARESLELVNYIAQIHRKGSSLEVAKSSSAQKFGCSLRTIERLWASRAALPDDERTIDDAFEFISQSEN